MNKDFNDKWLMLENDSIDSATISARKLSSVIGVDFLDKKPFIARIITPDARNFYTIVDMHGNHKPIEEFHAKTWSELLIALDLAGCLFDEPRIP